MTIRAPVNQFGLIALSNTVFAYDTVTPGNNTYGTYAAMLPGSEVLEDCYGIWITVVNGAVSGAARNTLAKLGVDTAGGTSYTDLIVDLAVPCAGGPSASNGGCGGINYYFPLFFKAGTSIAIAGSVNNATVGTFDALIHLAQKPSGPVIPRMGSFVRTFGSTPASSSGTAVTPNGSGSKSAYVQLGSSVADPLWHWSFGVCINNASMNNASSMWDLAIGDATNKRIVVPDMLVMPGAVETMAFTCRGAPALAGVGDNVYVRAGSNSASPTGMSAIAYGVGG